MNLKSLALTFGVVFLVIGVLGFIPAFAPDGYLLGIFQINGLHNGVHILSGIAAILAGMSSESNSRLYFMVFGIVYTLVTVLGLLTGSALGIGLIPVNTADNILHIVIAATSLYLGFATSSRTAHAVVAR